MGDEVAILFLSLGFFVMAMIVGAVGAGSAKARRGPTVPITLATVSGPLLDFSTLRTIAQTIRTGREDLVSLCADRMERILVIMESAR